VNSTPASGSQARAVQVTRWLPDRRAQDKVRNAQERQALRAGERTGLVPRERNAVVADEFGDDADAGHARHGHQVGRGLGVPGPLEHAARAGAQREHVPGAPQVGGACSGTGQHTNGRCPVGRGDAGYPRRGDRR